MPLYYNTAAIAKAGTGSITLTSTGDTNVTLPTTGTLATLAGAETFSSKTLTAPKFADLGFIADANGNELIILDTVASAVNEVTFANAATGSSPIFTASGGDSNVGMTFTMKGTGVFTLNGDHVITQPAWNTGVPTGFLLTGGAHTGLTASTEAIDFNLNLARTVQFATGALTTQRAVLVQAPTYAFVGASTLTTAVTFEISGAPVAGTNATITNTRAFRVAAGASDFGGNITLTGTNSIISFSTTTGTPLIRSSGGNTAFEIEGNLSAATTGIADVNIKSNATRTAGQIFSIQNNTTTRFSIAFHGGQTTTMGVASTGTARLFVGTNANHTSQTASTEINNISSTAYTRTWATGAIATQREVFFGLPTYAFAGASTITDAANVYIAGAPVAGTNATLTNRLALWVAADTSRFGGRVLKTQGADVASATNLTLGSDGNSFELTGTTKVDLISNVGWTEGSVVTLIANESVVIDHGTTTSGTNVQIRLAGAADFSMTAGDTLTLILSSTTAEGQAWREIGRAVI